MSAQLSLLGAGMCAPPTATRMTGEARDFVLGSIPSVGHRRGTAREKLLRPVAELYWREGDIWHREKTKRHMLEMPRADSRRVARTHGPAQWWLTLLKTDFAEVTDFAALIEPGLVACGAHGRLGSRMTCALLPSLEPLVIALCWDDATKAGCLLATAHEPRSLGWRVEVDRALDHGLPWAVRLAELTELHGPLVRAWRWLWDEHPNRWEECDECGGHGMVDRGHGDVQDCPADCHQGKTRTT